MMPEKLARDAAGALCPAPNGNLTIRQRIRLKQFRHLHPEAEIGLVPGFGFWAGWLPDGSGGGICVNRYEGLDRLLDDLESAMRAGSQPCLRGPFGVPPPGTPGRA